MTAFMRLVHSRHCANVGDYAALHQWSVDHLGDFWSTLWDYAGIVAEARGETVIADAGRMPGARFFPDARLNFAQNLLRRRDAGEAIVFRGETKVTRRLSHAELYDAVSRVAQALTAAGVVKGDRVGAWLPNMPETIIAMLAAASIGAIWTSCSPDFGAQGVIDRFGQTGPKVLFACDGYFGNGKAISSLAAAV